MIDISTIVFDSVKEAALKVDPEAFVTSMYLRTVNKFPAVFVVEDSNRNYIKTADTASSENHVKVQYTIEIYTNNLNGRKALCDNLTEAIDTVMLNYGFDRIMSEPVPNMSDATIYRRVSRYRAVVSATGLVYRK